jgi:hypothetical protein
MDHRYDYDLMVSRPICGAPTRAQGSDSCNQGVELGRMWRTKEPLVVESSNE